MIAILIFLLLLPRINAQVSPPPVLPAVTLVDATTTVKIESVPSNSLFVQNLVNKYAIKYQVSADTLWKVINCECPSLAFDCPSGVIRADGSEEPSFGLAQIDREYHPEIPYNDVVDPDYAISFMAQYMAQGRYSMWACYGILKSRNQL